MAETSKYLTDAQKKAIANQKKLFESALKKVQDGLVSSLTPQEEKALETELGPIARLIASDSSLLKLMQKALEQKWYESPTGIARFQAELLQTPWAVERSTSQRDYDTDAANPAQAENLKELRNSILVNVRRYVNENLGLDQSKADIESKIQKITDTLIRDNYRNWGSVLADKVNAEFSDVKATDIGGRIASTLTDVRGFYRSMGLQVSDDALNNYTKGILNNTISYETIQNNVRKDAAKMWSQFSDRILGGESLQNILYPYTQLIGSMLEVADPASLDFTAEDPSKPASMQIDPLLQKALFSSADGKQTMSLTDLRKAIKQDTRWQYTKNAQEEYAGLTTSLMRMFGAGV